MQLDFPLDSQYSPAFVGLLYISYTQYPSTFLGMSYAHAMIFGYDVILYR